MNKKYPQSKKGWVFLFQKFFKLQKARQSDFMKSANILIFVHLW